MGMGIQPSQIGSAKLNEDFLRAHEIADGLEPSDDISRNPAEARS
ncbi:MAG: hypothetical protein WCQ50_08780 [Spirochaetota bacterium]